MRSRAAALACAVGLVAVLAADAVVVVVRRGRSPEHRAPTALDAVLPALEAFVERDRGLRFRRPVRVDLQSDADFTAALRHLRDRDRNGGQPSDVLVGVLRALGLVEGRFDPSTLGPSTDSEVLGYYDARRGRLLVRGDQPTPAVRRVLVHELTHALDDQHFGLQRPALDRDGEAGIGFTALVEGDAIRVEGHYFDSLSPEERRAADLAAEPTSGPPSGVPRIFDVLLSFPYIAGRNFVDALVGAGGTARVDAAFSHPPATTEEILHPERYMAGTTVSKVADPRADGAVTDKGALGELLLRLVLAETLDRPGAARAADGWDGDRYVAWSDGARTCVRDALRMDSPADRAEVVDALHRWAAAHPGTSVDEGSPITFTRCG